MQAQFAQSRKIWSPKDPSRSRAEALRRFVNRKHGLSLSTLAASTSQASYSCIYGHAENYHDLHKYSVTDWTFWQDLWEWLGIIYSAPAEKVSLYTTTS